MAVTLSSKFYEETNYQWHDISKIVFTSPNMETPQIAGTRSHILPGQGALGLWYEDTSNMYRIENDQVLVQTSFFNSETTVVSGSVDNSVLYVSNPSDDNFMNNVRDATGVEISGYDEVNGDIIDTDVNTEYNAQGDIEQIYYAEDVGENQTYGWKVDIVQAVTTASIDIEFHVKTRIVRMKFKAAEYVDTLTDPEAPTTTKYFFGNYTIQAKLDADSSWSTIYTGANTNTTDKTIYLGNSNYYKFYRINITNNTGLSGASTSHYGMRGLVFEQYAYSTEPGPSDVTMYNFITDSTAERIYVSNVEDLPGDTSSSSDNYLTQEVVEGVMTDGTTEKHISVSDAYQGGTSHGSYTYAMFANFTKTDNPGTGSASCDLDDFIPVPVSITWTHNASGPSGFVATGQKQTTTYDPTYRIETTYDYTITASGTGASTLEGNTTVTGTFDRDVTIDKYPKEASYKMTVSSTTYSGSLNDFIDDKLYMWGYSERPLDMDVKNSIVFNVEFGEAYNCRLTAWDDSTHSTVSNPVFLGDHCRVSALAYRGRNSILDPDFSFDPENFIMSPVYNRNFKGNQVVSTVNQYYGDFDLVHQPDTDVYGDFLIFKPVLYGITDSFPYGVHDFVITLHYSYT
jgi:hypothetical protein